MVDDPLVEVFATEEGIAIGRENFELHLAVDIGNLDDRHVEGAAAQVIDRDFAVLAAAFIQTEGECRSRRLIDDALDLEAGDSTGVLGCLALGIIEVGRHGNHRLGHFLTKVILGGLFHLAKHLGRHLRGRNLLVAHLHPGVAVIGLRNGVGHQRDVFLDFFFLEFSSDQSLDRIQGIARIGDRLPLGRRADQYLAVFHVGDDRRRGAGAFSVFDDFGLTALHDRHARVGRAEVDSNDLAHFSDPVEKLNDWLIRWCRVSEIKCRC